MCCAEVVVSIGGTGNPFCLLVPPLRGGLITFLLLISLPSMISMQKDCTTPPHCFTMNSASYRWPKLKTEKKINGDLMWITSYLTSSEAVLSSYGNLDNFLSSFFSLPFGICHMSSAASIKLEEKLTGAILTTLMLYEFTKS